MARESHEQPWYHDGLKFTCTQCGDCCTGEPGYVWLNSEEIDRLAKRLGETRGKFLQLYVKSVGVRRSLRELPDGSCVFFRKGVGCTVYEDRPRQCRTWPFWESNIRNREAWEYTCEICPGSGQGKLFTVEEILEQSKVIKI